MWFLSKGWNFLLIACSSTTTKTKTKTKTKAFVRSCMFWNKPVTNEPIILCNVILRAWFIRHRHYLGRTKTFVLGFVFVLAHDQPINERYFHPKSRGGADWASSSDALGLKFQPTPFLNVASQSLKAPRRPAHPWIFELSGRGRAYQKKRHCHRAWAATEVCLYLWWFRMEIFWVLVVVLYLSWESQVRWSLANSC